jgi:GT2 family glycosyltransferase
MRTAVITIASGRHDHLRRQLAGLTEGVRVPDRHVVVAMGDPDLAGVVGEPVVDLPVTGANLPLARARNLGAAHALAAGAELLVFLDVDCIPGPRLVARYEEVARDSSAGALLCGPVTYLPPARDYPLRDLPGMTDPHPGRPVPRARECRRGGDHTLFWSLSFATTAATWREIGGFCEDYTGYGGEDTDFGQLARTAGVDLWWVGGAHAYHQYHPVEDPPVNHLDDIVANATVFHRRWGWWPMTDWLAAFAEAGLLRHDPKADRWERVPSGIRE